MTKWSVASDPWPAKAILATGHCSLITEVYMAGPNPALEPVQQPRHPIEERDSVTIRFAGDSGDGMQLAGTQFTNTSAVLGNDIATFPDFPAEIRAPAGTLAGVSGFQIHFSRFDIHTPGDRL